MLIAAAKSIEDNNETLKNLLLPENGELPFINAVWNGKMDIVEKLLKVAKEIENDNHTLKQLLLKKYNGESALRTASRRGYVDIIKLLLETASALGINHTMTKQLLLNETGGESALHVAVRDGRVDVMKVLLETACDLGIDDDSYTLKQLLLNEKYEESVLYAAVRKGRVDVIKMLLEKASDLGIDDDNYTLKQLLLKRRYGESVLNVAMENGHIDVIKMLLEKASDLGIDDDSYTLKQLLLKADNRLQRSALHVAAKCAGGDIIKLLLETASALGIEMLEKLITAVDSNGQNAIELMFKNGKETLFIDSLKTLEEDKYQNIRKKVMEMFDNVPLETRLYFHKKMLIKAIKRNDIKKVKDILIKVKNSSINHNESLRILLLEDESFSRNILSIACEEGYSEIIKELLSCAKEIDDDNHTLKQLILNKTSGASSLHFAVENGHPDVITLLLKTASDSGIDMLEEITDIKRKNLGFDLIYECGMVNEYGCDTLKRMLLRLNHVIEEWGFSPLDNISLLESKLLFSEEDVDQGN